MSNSRSQKTKPSGFVQGSLWRPRHSRGSMRPHHIRRGARRFVTLSSLFLPSSATILGSGPSHSQRGPSPKERTTMKRLIVCTSLLIAAAAILAQQKPASPTETATGTIGGKAVSITYASPRVNGRVGHLFSPGGQISHDPHYPVWRGGANAATTI